MPSGDSVVNFSVAVKSGYGDKEKTNWVRCALFGKRAEGGLPQYLTKGAQVIVSGELELQEWEGQNGKGSALSVRVSEITLAGGKQDNQGQQAGNSGGYGQQPPAQPASFGGNGQGGFGDPWAGLVPAGEAKQNGATIEAIKNHKDIQGDAAKAKQFGWVAESNDDLPF